MTDQNDVQQTIIDEFGLSDLPKEKQEELLSKMTEVVLERIFLETMDKLTPAQQEEYGGMVERQVSPGEMEAWLKQKISGYDGMVKKIVEDFKLEMKSEI